MSDVLGKCPVCKDGDIIEKEKNFHCSKAKWEKDGETWTNKGCKYSIFKQGLAKNGKPEITKDEVIALLTNGTVEIELTSKKQMVVNEQYGVQVVWK